MNNNLPKEKLNDKKFMETMFHFVYATLTSDEFTQLSDLWRCFHKLYSKLPKYERTRKFLRAWLIMQAPPNLLPEDDREDWIDMMLQK